MPDQNKERGHGHGRHGVIVERGELRRREGIRLRGVQHLFPGDADVETAQERGPRAGPTLQMQSLFQDMP